MPFSCIAKLEAHQLRNETIVFDSWIEDVWHSYVPAGTAFARCHDANGDCTLLLAGPGYLSSKPKLVSGDVLLGGAVVAFFNADGEAIPYGKPYALVRYG